MESTPANPWYNPEVLAMMPAGLRRVVDVGCSRGQLAKAYRASNPDCDYRGIEIDPDYAEAARQHCTAVICDDIETLADDEFLPLFPSDCWIFADSLEHLRDPWAVLRRIRPQLRPDAQIIACIPNAQHWSVQVRLNVGELRYEKFGLLDRTHLRWFTRLTMLEMFAATGYKVIKGIPRIFDEPRRDQAMPAIRALATAMGADARMAGDDAMVYQWVLCATPA